MDVLIKWVGFLPSHIVVVYFIQGILPVSSLCGQGLSNSTTCNPTPPIAEDDDDSGPQRGFYTVAILLGVVGLPLVILFRICYARRLNRNTNRRINEIRNQIEQSHQDRQVVFVVAQEPENFLPSYEQTIADSPPSYDQLDLPPPYKLNPNKSLTSLPSYSVEDPHTPGRSSTNPGDAIS